MTQYEARSPSPSTPDGATSGATDAVRDVAHTAAREARGVADEVREQARRTASTVGEKVRGQAETQQQRWASQLERASSDFRQMSEGAGESPARTLVVSLADRSSMLADYLNKRSPQDLLTEVKNFARRRPAAFLVAAAATGFVVGRLGKGMAQSAGHHNGGQGGRDAYSSGPGPTSTPAMTPAAPTTSAVPTSSTVPTGSTVPGTSTVPTTSMGSGQVGTAPVDPTGTATGTATVPGQTVPGPTMAPPPAEGGRP